MKKFFEDFKAFIARGNVIDMAVAVVVGGAFGKIVTSLVNDIIMPLIGLISGGSNVAELKWVIREAVVDAAGNVTTPETALTYGTFLQTVIDFLLISFCIFIFLRILLNAQTKFKAIEEKLKKQEEKKEEEAAAEEKKETTEEILSEIRELLKNKQQ